MRRLIIFSLSLANSLAMAVAQDMRPQATSYCSDLKQVVDLALSKERFAAISGQPRQGNFLDTKLALPNWKDCSLYGLATYTCDSSDMETAEEAERAQSTILDQIKSCLGEGWAEPTDRSSPTYVVLHHALRPVSITLSTDQTPDKKHIVHLILFVRRN
jgi:hypothetical protein